MGRNYCELYKNDRVLEQQLPPFARRVIAIMAGPQVLFCLLVCATAVLVADGTLSPLDLALLPQSEWTLKNYVHR